MKRRVTIALAFAVLVACVVLLFALDLLDGTANAVGQRVLRVGEWAGRLRERSAGGE